MFPPLCVSHLVPQAVVLLRFDSFMGPNLSDAFGLPLVSHLFSSSPPFMMNASRRSAVALSSLASNRVSHHSGYLGRVSGPLSYPLAFLERVAPLVSHLVYCFKTPALSLALSPALQSPALFPAFFSALFLIAFIHA